jgi:biotin operon repressor
MGYKVVYPDILQYLSERIGVITNTTEIATELDITTEQVRGGISTLQRHGHTIENVGRGYAYIYQRSVPKIPEPAPIIKGDKRLFEEVGTSKLGIVIQDVQGVLYIAKEL